MINNMMQLPATVLNHILTGKDGESYEFAKVLTFGLLISFILAGIYVAIHDFAHFSLMDYALGGTGIIGGGSVSTKVKESTEPQ